MTTRFSVSAEIDRKFASSEWRNGFAILRTVHAAEWDEIKLALNDFNLLHSQLVAKGRGNKSEMAGTLDSSLYAHG